MGMKLRWPLPLPLNHGGFSRWFPFPRFTSTSPEEKVALLMLQAWAWAATPGSWAPAVPRSTWRLAPIDRPQLGGAPRRRAIFAHVAWILFQRDLAQRSEVATGATSRPHGTWIPHIGCFFLCVPLCAAHFLGRPRLSLILSDVCSPTNMEGHRPSFSTG